MMIVNSNYMPPAKKTKPWRLIVGVLFIAFSNIALSATVVKPVPKPVIKIRLNDTGITTCSNNTRNGLRCPVTGFPGQDAQYGRDKTLNRNADGFAGFSFTKISSTGKALPANAPRWNCVKDNVTGLLWEGKTADGGLHDMNWTYSWYNPVKTTNGGAPGFQNNGKCATFTGCDTYAYVRAVNAAGWCGQKAWRLPTVEELTSLTSFRRTSPALETAYFPDANISGVWSSTPYAPNIGGFVAWYVDFSIGRADSNPEFYAKQVRLVR
jgi:hypothetical protein